MKLEDHQTIGTRQRFLRSSYGCARKSPVLAALYGTLHMAEFMRTLTTPEGLNTLCEALLPCDIMQRGIGKKRKVEVAMARV